MNEYNKIITKINNEDFFPIYILVGDENYFAENIKLTNLFENNLIGARESHRILLEISPIESWKMGKLKKKL